MGSTPTQILWGQELSPEAVVPEGFMQSDQVSCGVYCMMLMAVWTAAAAGHTLQLPCPLDATQARAWLAAAMGSNAMPRWAA